MNTSNGTTVRCLLALALAGSSVALGGCVASVDDDGVEDVVTEEAGAGANMLHNGGFEERAPDATPVEWNVDTMGASSTAFVIEDARLPKQVDPKNVGGGAFGLWVDDLNSKSNIAVWQLVQAVNANANADVTYELKAWSRRLRSEAASETGTQRLNASCLDVNAELISNARHRYLPSPTKTWRHLRRTFSCPAGTYWLKVSITGSNKGWESRAWDKIILTKKAL